MRRLAPLLALALPLMSASAQRRGVELGTTLASASVTDYRYPSDLTSPNTFSHLGIGSQSVNVGLYLGPGFALEPGVLLGVDHTTGITATSVQFRVAAPIYLRHDWGHSGFYIAPRAGVTSSSSGGPSESQYFVGLGAGVKVRVVEPVSLRVEVVGVDAFEHGDPDGVLQPGYSSVALNFGMSVFFH